MHILVTGGCGYIGSVLTRQLLEDGHRLTVVDAQWFGNCLTPHANLTVIREDIRNIDAIPMAGVESIIHLANVS
ncbi:MAG: NAD-dependent epimerase/dehydratase family protein, partial [Syntrophobacteraceae bacterium]